MCNSNYYAFQDDGRAILNKLPLLIAFILFFVLWGFFGFIFFSEEETERLALPFVTSTQSGASVTPSPLKYNTSVNKCYIKPCQNEFQCGTRHFAYS